MIVSLICALLLAPSECTRDGSSWNTAFGFLNWLMKYMGDIRVIENIFSGMMALRKSVQDLKTISVFKNYVNSELAEIKFSF